MHRPMELVPGVYGLGSASVNWYIVEEGGALTAVDAGLPAFAASPSVRRSVTPASRQRAAPHHS